MKIKLKLIKTDLMINFYETKFSLLCLVHPNDSLLLSSKIGIKNLLTKNNVFSS